jgi:hypothetical protein
MNQVLGRFANVRWEGYGSAANIHPYFILDFVR